MKQDILKGDIYLVDLGERFGSEQSGKRPVLVIQNNTGNKYSPTIIVATITTSVGKKTLPTHFTLETKDCGIKKTSTVLFEQILTIDKKRLIRKVGQVGEEILSKLDEVAKISLGIT